MSVNTQEIDPSTIQAFEGPNALLFLGSPTFNSAGANAVFGMITGCRSHVPGLEKGLEIRRVLTRAPRMEVQLHTFVKDLHRSSLSGVAQAETFGVGWGFRDTAGWGLALYYENCRFVRSYIENSGALPVVEDVLILSYENETNITHHMQMRVRLAGTEDMPKNARQRG